MEKIKSSQIAKGILRRVLHPQHLSKAFRLQRRKRYVERIYDDPQLKLYGEILPGGFLHYGYFDDPNIAPQDISFNDISRAQLRYAELIVAQIVNSGAPVLDIGCGLGGITRMMLDEGLCPVALSPDKHQIRHIKSQYPTVHTIESKFETMPAKERQQKYGTLITAESLQYLDLDAALPLMNEILLPGGRWIACDYFRMDGLQKKSESWSSFEKRIEQSNFCFVSQQDITLNILPTTRYLYMLGHDIGRPLVHFFLDKMQTKQPGAHYLLHDVLELLNAKVEGGLEVVNPATFAIKSKYMLLVMEKQ